MKTCVILGASGHAREVYWQAKIASNDSFQQYLFVDDLNSITSIEVGEKSWPVIQDWNFLEYQRSSAQIGFIVGVGNPKVKVQMVERALKAGLAPLPTIIHPSVVILDPACTIGQGGMISPNCVLTTNIKIADYVILNVGVSVGHDVQIDDFVTCAPQVAIAGNVHLKKGVSLGIGSIIREKLTIAPFVTIGAQACVLESINEPDSVLVGVPAKTLKNKI